MDGFAVRAADLHTLVNFASSVKSPRDNSGSRHSAGEAMAIMTGALPPTRMRCSGRRRATATTGCIAEALQVDSSQTGATCDWDCLEKGASHSRALAAAASVGRASTRCAKPRAAGSQPGMSWRGDGNPACDS